MASFVVGTGQRLIGAISGIFCSCLPGVIVEGELFVVVICALQKFVFKIILICMAGGLMLVSRYARIVEFEIRILVDRTCIIVPKGQF